MIRLYLDTDNRLPWNAADPQQASYGLWAGYWVATATAVRGISFETLRAWLPQQTPLSRDAIGRIVTLSQWIVSDADPFTLAPFRPDLIGETFFLLFLERIQHDPFCDVLTLLIYQSNEDAPHRVSKDFLDFLFRLIEGLTRETWQWSERYFRLLLGFLSQKIFHGGSTPSLVVATALARLYLVLFSLFTHVSKTQVRAIRNLLSLCDKKINLNRLLLACGGDLGFSPLNVLITYYDQKAKEEDTSDYLKIVVLTALQHMSKLISESQNTYINSLFLASLWDRLAVLDLVLADRRTSVNEIFENDFTVLLVSTWMGKTQVVDRLLKEPNIEVNKSLSNGVTALYIACEMGNEDMVSVILRDETTNPNVPTSFGSTPLIIAMGKSHNIVANMMIENSKVELNFQNSDVISPLLYAIINNNKEIAIKLIAIPGVKINIGSYEHNITALHFACGSGNFPIVEALLNRRDIKANGQASDEKGTTLMLACAMAHKEVVKLMVSHKAVSINAVDAYGRTAMDYALTEGHADIIGILREYGGRRGNEAI